MLERLYAALHVQDLLTSPLAVLDVLLLAVVIYQLLLLVRGTRTANMMIALAVLVVFYLVTAGPGLLSQIYYRQGMQAPDGSTERVEGLEKAISTGHITVRTLKGYGELVNVYGRRGEFELALERDKRKASRTFLTV